jgi:autotransporter-associated beta strand protein
VALIFQHSISAIGNLTATRNFSLPNASNPVFYSYGGSVNIRSIRITSSSQFGTDIAIIGDSKVQGYSSGNFNLRYASLLNSLGNVTAFGGDGDGTASCVSTIPYIVNYIKPKQVLLAIGSNDIRGGVAAATWQANYSTIVSTLQANGINVIHLLPVPEGGGLDQSALYNFIVNTYGAQNCIDPSLNWQAGYNSTDNVHPNSIGHRKIANDIVASGKIGTTNIANYAYPENNNLLDALPKTGNGSVVLNNNAAFTGTTSISSERLTNIPTGSAGTDSLLVKSASTNLVQKIPANYYASTASVTPNNFRNNASTFTLPLTNLTNYGTFYGTTATWTLGTVAAGSNVTYYIKNAGSGVLTINSAAGGNDIYYTSGSCYHQHSCG